MAALCWAGIALSVRLTPAAALRPEQQLWGQLMISGVVLCLMALLYGPLIRELVPMHFLGMLFQVLAVASFGFLFWFFLMKRYPASTVASFALLSPVAGVGFGWLFLDEAVGPEIIGGLVLVALGITLINRRPQVPQKV